MAQSALGRAVFYMTPMAVSMVVPFLTLPVMTRWLTPADYGTVALGQVVGLLFVGLASCGVRLGVERNFFKYERDPRGLGHMIHSALAVVVVGMLGWGLLLYAVRDYVSRLLYGAPTGGSLIMVLCATSALGMIATMQLVYLRNAGEARLYMRASIAAVLLESALSVALLVWADAGVWALAWGPLVGKVVVVSFVWWRIAQQAPFGLSPSAVRELLGLGVADTPRMMLSVADNGVDRLLIAWLNSLGQAGLFSMANRIGLSVFSVMTSIEQVYLPQVYRYFFDGDEHAGVRLGRYLSPYFYLSTMPAVIVILFIEELLWLLVTPGFYQVKYMVALLATYYGQMFFSKIAGTQFIYMKKIWYGGPLTMARLAIHLAFAAVLVFPLGGFGSALAILLTGVVVDSFVFRLGQRTSRIVYEMGVIVPVLALLYASTSWVLLAGWLELPYAVRLLGKFTIVALLLVCGRRWAGLAKRELGTVARRLGWRAARAPAPGAGPSTTSEVYVTRETR